MGLKSSLRNALNAMLRRYGYEVIEGRRVYDWQRHSDSQRNYTKSTVPREAMEYLRQENPRLQEMQTRYSAFSSEVTAPVVWIDTHVRPTDIPYFRGDRAYVWQLMGPNMNVMAYALTTFYVKSIDKLRLLEVLKEDEWFGVFTFRIDNKLISRDLLDSIVEIYFLDKHLDVTRAKNLTILDIGAGYGRLAHRMVSALPNIETYLCTDAVAVSSFISEYYLRFRGIDGKAKVIPLDEIEDALKERSISLAVNIHSFSECRISAINWWLARLRANRVRYLMIVPNADTHGGERLVTNHGDDFGEAIEKHGYKLVAKEPKYRDPVVQKYGVNPTYHYLFELQ